MEICNHCGLDVSYGSEKFIDRIPDFNDLVTRMENGLKFPLGDFICRDCDDNLTTASEE